MRHAQSATIVASFLVASIRVSIALLVTGFLVWNSRQRNERLAVGLFIAGAVIVVVLVVVSQ